MPYFENFILIFWIFILAKKCSYHSKNFHPWISFFDFLNLHLLILKIVHHLFRNFILDFLFVIYSSCISESHVDILKNFIFSLSKYYSSFSKFTPFPPQKSFFSSWNFHPKNSFCSFWFSFFVSQKLHFAFQNFHLCPLKNIRLPIEFFIFSFSKIEFRLSKNHTLFKKKLTPSIQNFTFALSKKFTAVDEKSLFDMRLFFFRAYSFFDEIKYTPFPKSADTFFVISLEHVSVMSSSLKILIDD